MLVESPSTLYEVLKLIAYAPNYRLYLCRDASSGRGYLLQVSTGIAHNGGLERAAFVLRTLANSSRHHDELYAAEHDGHKLHYDRLFPGLIETFVSKDQGNRRINVLTFTDVENVAKLLPMSNLRTKDRLRIDPKTDAWIVGRLLKLLTIVHLEGISVRTLSSNNILLEPDKHFAIVLDWTSAWMYQSEAPRADAAVDVVRAVEAGYDALGDIDTRSYSYDDADLQYIDLLNQIKGQASQLTTNEAHTVFYDKVRAIWPTEFHPFTAMPL